MRILYVTNGFPFPLTSGYLRHYFLIRELSARHSITLLSIVGADYEAGHGEALAPYTERVETFPSANRSRSRGRKALARLDALRGSGAAGPAQRLGRAAAALARNESFDAVLLSGKRTVPALPFLAGLPLVVDICDTASARIRGSIRYAPPLRRPLLALEAFEVRRAERRLAAAGDALLFASVRDRGLLLSDIRSRGLSPRTLVVPNGVDVDYWQRSAKELGRAAIVFTGKMDYPPNDDAALVLAETVLPRCGARCGMPSCWIVGARPDRPPARGRDESRRDRHRGGSRRPPVPRARRGLRRPAASRRRDPEQGARGHGHGGSRGGLAPRRRDGLRTATTPTCR